MKKKLQVKRHHFCSPPPMPREQFLLAQQHMVDTNLRGKPPNKQLTDLLFLFSKKSLQGKPFQISGEHAAARKRTVTEFLLALRKIGRPCRNLKFVTRQSIFDVAQYWRANGMSISTVASRISHLNWLLMVLGKSERAVQKDILGTLAKNSPLSSEAIDSLPPSAPVDEQEIMRCLELATQLDRFVGSQLHLIYHLHLAPREVMGLKPTLNFYPATSVLAVEEGTRSRKMRLVGPLNPTQTELILNAQRLMEGYAEDQTYSPNFTKKEAMRRFYYFARKAGFIRATGGVTPDQLAKVPH